MLCGLMRIFFEKKAGERIVNSRKVTIFAHLFSDERGADEKQNVLLHLAGITQLVE